MVWVHDLKREDYEPMNEKMLARLDAMLSPRPKLNLFGIWQTQHDLHMLDEFRQLCGFIDTAAKGVLDFLEVEYGSFQITGCWANISPRGSPHAPHSHPNNFLSGVYYVRAPRGANTISFHDPRPAINIIAPAIKQRNPYNSSEASLTVKEGRLILFPAWFKHSVPYSEGEEERVSISFNIMFSSFAETMSKPKWTGIATS
jgi:uncharacterized protein (TIGR02466 family)